MSGHLRILMNDGTEIDGRAGEAHDIEPGQDGWVVGDEPYVAIDVSREMADYATAS